MGQFAAELKAEGEDIEIIDPDEIEDIDDIEFIEDWEE